MKKTAIVLLAFAVALTAASCKKDKPFNLDIGALPGVFSVSSDGGKTIKKVSFSKGNLYFNGSNGGFEQEQYYFRTYSGGGKCDAGGYDSESGTASGHWGLFGWSTSTNYGMSTSEKDSDYYGGFVDWGKAIDGKGTWRTLTGGENGEWKYLFDNHVSVCDTCNSVPGLFIAPDSFEGDTTDLLKAVKNWKTAQAAGIVFLPAAGNRSGTFVFAGEFGHYWSSSMQYGDNAFCIMFGSKVYPDIPDKRHYGFSVRLVTECQ